MKRFFVCFFPLICFACCPLPFRNGTNPFPVAGVIHASCMHQTTFSPRHSCTFATMLSQMGRYRYEYHAAGMSLCWVDKSIRSGIGRQYIAGGDGLGAAKFKTNKEGLGPGSFPAFLAAHVPCALVQEQSQKPKTLFKTRFIPGATPIKPFAQASAVDGVRPSS